MNKYAQFNNSANTQNQIQNVDTHNVTDSCLETECT